MATTDPPRPLGIEGTKVWDAWHRKVTDKDRLLTLAETVDERTFLRTRVLRDGNPADREALRTLDRTIETTLAAVKDDANWRRYQRTI